mmetsp:Transcript_102181/g.256141  ORF Transcript_102181/g.256141 Transcript_102181/m.256141 type:complete len:287 (-) Transcript_102181:304-1164(-)
MPLLLSTSKDGRLKGRSDCAVSVRTLGADGSFNVNVEHDKVEDGVDNATGAQGSDGLVGVSNSKPRRQSARVAAAECEPLRALRELRLGRVPINEGSIVRERLAHSQVPQIRSVHIAVGNAVAVETMFNLHQQRFPLTGQSCDKATWRATDATLAPQLKEHRPTVLVELIGNVEFLVERAAALSKGWKMINWRLPEACLRLRRGQGMVSHLLLDHLLANLSTQCPRRQTTNWHRDVGCSVRMLLCKHYRRWNCHLPNGCHARIAAWLRVRQQQHQQRPGNPGDQGD